MTANRRRYQRRPLEGLLSISVAALGLCTLTSSCTSVSAQNPNPSATTNSLLPTAETAVFVTRVGDELTISWLAKTGLIYTLISKDRSRQDSVWTPVPGYENMPGTGRQESIVLRVPPDDRRVFNITTVAPASPAGRRRR